MTFEEWAGPEPPRYSKSWYRWEYEREGWDAATAAERARCRAAIWEHRGKCASDEAARALMEEMERTP